MLFAERETSQAMSSFVALMRWSLATSHTYADDHTEESNLYIYKMECYKKSKPIKTLEEANKMDCWYRVRMMDDDQVWVTSTRCVFSRMNRGDVTLEKGHLISLLLCVLQRTKLAPVERSSQ